MGEVLALTFSLPASTVVWHVRTVVRHRRRYHHGLEFLSLSQEQSTLLAACLAGLERAEEKFNRCLIPNPSERQERTGRGY